VTIQVLEFDNGYRELTLSECPCGHVFEPSEKRCRHFLLEHSPEDFGLSPIGETPADVDAPLFEPIEELPGGGSRAR
jgi:hypothetical protein